MKRLPRLVLITGASSGIGMHTAEAFSSAGDNLLLVARRLDRLEKIKSDLVAKFKNEITVLKCDLADPAGLQKFFQEHDALLSATQILVNNAGLSKGWAPFHRSQPEEWRQILDTNIKGTMQMIRYLAPKMVQRRSGHIINIGSIAGRWAYPNDAVYCASKFAVRTMTESLQVELRGTQVRVSVVEPGPVKTEFIDVRHNSKAIGDRIWQNLDPLQPEDIAQAVYWVADQPNHMNIQELVMFPTKQSAIFLTERTT